MADYSSAHELLSRVVDHLAVAPEPLQERLAEAWRYQGERIPIVDGGEEYPALASDLRDVHDRLCHPVEGDEGFGPRVTDADKILAMSDCEAMDAVRHVLRLDEQVEALYRRLN